VARSSHLRIGNVEVRYTKEEGRGKTMGGAVIIEEKKRGSCSKITGGVGCCEGNNKTTEGSHRIETLKREGARGPYVTFT